MLTESLPICLQSDRLPRRPYCTDDLATGLRIRPLSRALQFKYLQLNRPDWLAWMIFDLDRPGAAFEWLDKNLPPPTWSTTSGRGHAHLVYSLEVPVYLGETARAAPMNLARAIQHSMSVRLGADPCYKGLITRNPLHPQWITAVHAGTPRYELHDLLEWVEPKSPTTGQPGTSIANALGSRNVALFDQLRHAAYSQVLSGRLSGLGEDSWTALLVSLADSMNQYQPPLAQGEVRAIARSVAKWTWRRYTGRLPDDQFSTLQSERGKRKGAEKRKKGKSMLRDGWSVMQVAHELLVGRATVYRWQSEIAQSGSAVSIPNQITAEAKKPRSNGDTST
nr:replication initiation protein [uncultured Aquabacterium sp.]